MSSPSLSSAVASAATASERALRALLGLAEALGTPGTVAEALEEAKAPLGEAEAALARLEAAVAAEIAAAAKTAPTPGLDPEHLYRTLGDMADASASELERELSRNRRYCRVLRVVWAVALVLLLLCAPLLSLDVVRAALGVTQESHLVPCLATVTLASQVALWGLGTSQRHLATAARRCREQAQRYRHRARATAAATAATPEATRAINAANDTLEKLEVVTRHLRILVDVVTQDQEVAQGFSASAQALGDAVVALGTVMGDKEETQRLAQALEALRGDE